MIPSMNKPNGQTIFPTCGLSELLSTPSTKVQGLGGKLGQKLINHFNVKAFSDITENVRLQKLIELESE